MYHIYWRVTGGVCDSLPPHRQGNLQKCSLSEHNQLPNLTAITTLMHNYIELKSTKALDDVYHQLL